ncbi:MAG: hypothetical protein H6562_10280 [Lewinellaceae bacterium]|nr:hypothetical protein [Lewinella sp.]MCB9279292.1 hypothetical protein [Lewinellaceae bacterium]
MIRRYILFIGVFLTAMTSFGQSKIEVTGKVLDRNEREPLVGAQVFTNDIYRASRLNRAASGIFPGGFRQVIFGVNVRL